MRSQLCRLFCNSLQNPWNPSRILVKECRNILERRILGRNLHSDHVIALTDIVGQENVQADDLESFNSDWLGSCKGSSPLVLFPKSTSAVSTVLTYLSSHSLSAVVQSGNTSLVGGAVPAGDELIISMKKMNQILAFDEHSGVLECEAGCILQNLEDYVSNYNRLIPYDLGAKGSCLIGGNLATNAGGLRYVKYGPLHGNVLGMEVVLPDGRILDLMSGMRKDNTGYHLRHLFIGSEGTLGIITKVSILCPMDFKEKIALFVGLNSFASVLEFYKRIQAEFGEYISCFEMADSVSIESVVENLGKPIPLDRIYDFHVLVELSSNDAKHLEGRLLESLAVMDGKKMIGNATYSLDSNKRMFSALKGYREGIPEALKRDGYCYKYDISLPLDVYYQCVEVLRDRLESRKGIPKPTRICGYGHIGDTNLHFNVTSGRYEPEIKATIEPFIWEYVQKHRGSISAEHGIGAHKRNVLHYSKSSPAIEVMKDIKRLFDPKGTLNPQKVFL